MKKKSIHIIISVLVLVLLSQASVFSKSKIRLNHRSLKMSVGQTKVLKVINKPRGKKVKWCSKNKYIATVTKKGRVKAKKVGKTTIIATIKKKKYKCRVVVNRVNNKVTQNKAAVVQNETVTAPEYGLDPKDDNSERSIVTSLNSRLNVICHRGYKKLAPENSILAFKIAKQKGYNLVETDIKFTKDGVPVLLHDFTINRVARNMDGTEIVEPIYIFDISYEELLKYDFGLYKSQEFKGTKIVTLTEFLQLCKELDLRAYLHLFTGTESQNRELYSLVDQFGMKDKVTWFSYITTLLDYIKEIDNTARLELITDSVTPEVIDKAQALGEYGNPVVIDSASYTKEELELCKKANIPLEVYLFKSIEKVNSLDSYISGVTVEYIE